MQCLGIHKASAEVVRLGTGVALSPAPRRAPVLALAAGVPRHLGRRRLRRTQCVLQGQDRVAQGRLRLRERRRRQELRQGRPRKGASARGGRWSALLTLRDRRTGFGVHAHHR